MVVRRLLSASVAVLLVLSFVAGGARPAVGDPSTPARPVGDTKLHRPPGPRPSVIASDAAGDGWFVDAPEGGSDEQGALSRVTAAGVVTRFTDPGIVHPVGIAVGADGNVWFTDASGPPSVGRMTPEGVVTTFTSPDLTCCLGELVAGADGNVWTHDWTGVVRITAAGVITRFEVGQKVEGIAATSDGSVWFVYSVVVSEFFGDFRAHLGRVTPAGTFVASLWSLSHAQAYSVAPAGADQVWVGGFNLGGVVRVDADGTERAAATDLPADPDYRVPNLIAAGPDGSVWFGLGRHFGRIAADGSVTTFPLVGLFRATSMAARPDGSFWLVDGDAAVVVAPDGSMTRVVGPGMVRPQRLALGPDGNIWYTDADAIGRMTVAGELAVFAEGEVHPTDITTGPGGHLWFTTYEPDEADGAVVEMTADGVMVSTHPVAGRPTSIAAGADGNLWIVTAAGVTRMTPAGVTTSLPDGQLVGGSEITEGPDGNVWLAGDFGVLRITPGGVVTRMVFGPASVLTTGPDGNVWWASERDGTVGSITPAGDARTFKIPNYFSRSSYDPGLSGIAAGPDGNLWFTGGKPYDHFSVWRISPTGVISEIRGGGEHPEGVADPRGIVAGPDGAMWVAGSPNTIGSIGTGLYAPPAPTGVGVVAGAGSAAVSWSVGADNGSAPAVSYTATASPGGASCTVVVVPGASLGCTVAGLTNGVSHTFTVTATNRSGTSAASAATPPAVPMFSDVPPGAPFRDDIAWLAANGIATGSLDGTYRPTSPVSRAAMAAFLYRVWGSPDGVHPACSARFVDVAMDAPFCGEIWSLANVGIVAGSANGSFRPTAPVSRQAMAAFLYRLAGSPEGFAPTCAEAPYPDVAVGAPFCGEIAWLQTTGITTGYAGGTFHPADPVSRQAMAAFLHRFHDLP